MCAVDSNHGEIWELAPADHCKQVFYNNITNKCTLATAQWVLFTPQVNKLLSLRAH